MSSTLSTVEPDNGGHGSVMPVWGQIFSDEAAATSGLYGGVLETRGRILSLALFLESIQK